MSLPRHPLQPVPAETARVATALLFTKRARELNPLYARIPGTTHYLPTAIATALVVIALLLALQTFSVSQSRLGKRVALAMTWTLLIASAADAAWDLAQLIAH